MHSSRRWPIREITSWAHRSSTGSVAIGRKGSTARLYASAYLSVPHSASARYWQRSCSMSHCSCVCVGPLPACTDPGNQTLFASQWTRPYAQLKGSGRLTFHRAFVHEDCVDWVERTVGYRHSSCRRTHCSKVCVGPLPASKLCMCPAD